MAKKSAPLPAWLVAANAETRAAAEEAMRLRRPKVNQPTASTDAAALSARIQQLIN